MLLRNDVIRVSVVIILHIVMIDFMFLPVSMQDSDVHYIVAFLVFLVISFLAVYSCKKVYLEQTFLFGKSLIDALKGIAPFHAMAEFKQTRSQKSSYHKY